MQSTKRNHGGARRAVSSLVGASLVLGLLWIWASKASTVIEIAADGPKISASIDGRLVSEIKDSSMPAGAIVIELPPDQHFPTMLQSELESVRLDNEHGSAELLAELDCLQTPGGSAVCKLPREARDFKLRIACRNCNGIDVNVRWSDGFKGHRFFGELWYGLGCGWHTFTGAERPAASAGCILISFSLSMRETCKRILLELIPSVLAALLLVGVPLSILAIWGERRREPAAPQFPGGTELRYRAGAYAIAILSAVWIRQITREYLGDIPHVQDSMVYWFHSKMLAKGWLSVPDPPLPEHFEFQFMYHHAGRWFSQYPIGWPALLALGQLLGAPAVIPALLALLNVIALYELARPHFGARAALFSVLFLAFSPWFQMSSANFMSHHLSALLSILCVGSALRMQRLCTPFSGALCGGLFGLLYLTRPLNAAALAIACALQLLWWLWRARDSRGMLRSRLSSLLALLAAGLACSSISLANNWHISGDIFRNPYTFGPDWTSLDTVFSYWQGKQLPVALSHVFALLSLYRHVALSLPGEIAFLFGLAGVSLMGWKRCLPFVAPCLAIPVAYSSIQVLWSVMYGPRYWYETLPFVAILSGAGLSALCDLFGRIRLAEWVPLGCLPALLAVSLAWNPIHYWAFDESESVQIIQPWTPIKLDGLRDFNFVSPKISRAIAALERPAIVFLPIKPHWYAYGAGFFMNEPDLINGRVWVARDLGDEKNARLVALDPGRAVYKGIGNTGVLAPYDPAAAADGIAR